jgi:hypothetical protein
MTKDVNNIKSIMSYTQFREKYEYEINVQEMLLPAMQFINAIQYSNDLPFFITSNS